MEGIFGIQKSWNPNSKKPLTPANQNASIFHPKDEDGTSIKGNQSNTGAEDLDPQTKQRNEQPRTIARTHLQPKKLTNELIPTTEQPKKRPTLKSPTQVEVARPKWPLIRRVSSAHMFPVRSNYMVWKRLRAHFCVDNGLELAWSEATLFWDGLIRGHFGLGRSDQRPIRAHTSLTRDQFERHFFQVFFCFITDFCCLG